MTRANPLETWLLVLTACAHLACSQRSDIPALPPDQVPQRQFILDGVRMEERDGERLLWSAAAHRVDGDFSSADVHDVRVDYPRHGERATPVVMTAPSGQINLDAGTATFTSVRIAGPNGSVLTAATAIYNQQAQTVQTDGNLLLTAPGTTVKARQATLHLADGSVEIAGPVVGRHDPQVAKASRPPSTDSAPTARSAFPGP